MATFVFGTIWNVDSDMAMVIWNHRLEPSALTMATLTIFVLSCRFRLIITTISSDSVRQCWHDMERRQGILSDMAMVIWNQRLEKPALTVAVLTIFVLSCFAM